MKDIEELMRKIEKSLRDLDFEFITNVSDFKFFLIKSERGGDCSIADVWHSSLFREFAKISKVIQIGEIIAFRVRHESGLYVDTRYSEDGDRVTIELNIR